MDNVTHSLAGLLLAESAVRLRARLTGAEPSHRFRAVAAVSSLIAANLPDADLLYTGVGAERLRYMLDHRGYTHTILGAMVGAVIVAGLATLAMRWRAPHAATRDDTRWLFGLMLVSTLSHIVLDWTNSYGVHPFWPVDNRWRYGDAVFIVEPWLWVVSVPALVAASSRLGARIVLSLVMVIGLVLAWRVNLVSLGAAAVLTLGAAVSLALAVLLRPGARVAAAVSGWVVFTLVMFAASARARASTVHAVHEAEPNAELLDVVVSSLPANAVCMSVITVERSGATYRIATARVSSIPRVTDATHCGARDGGSPMLRPSTRRHTTAVRWEGEWTAPAAEVATLVRESCSALAAMRFIRVPIWRTEPDSMVLVGDVRYGGGSNGFTDVRVPRNSATCPRAVPPWTPPRTDLLLDATKNVDILRVMATTRAVDLSRAVELFHALSDETRLGIIEKLRSGERCVCDLQDNLDAAQSRLSFHLRVLKEAGLVSDRKDGRWSYYSIVPGALAEVHDLAVALQPAKLRILAQNNGRCCG